MTNRKTKILSIQFVLTICFLAFSLSLSQADVTLIVRDGSGPPGSLENPVAVSLDNPNDKVKGIQVDVCDVDDYLTCTGCETAERTSDFDCLINDFNGCCRVTLFPSTGGLIGEGTGDVFTLKYDISEDAPAGECRDLNPEGVSISDESGDPLPFPEAESGEFCFSASSTTTTTITTTTTTTTTAPSIDILQDSMWKSRWISLPYLMVIIGNNTHFKCFNSRLSFEPPLMLFPCFPIVWDEIHIWNFIWVMPGWLAGLEDQTVTVTVTTGDEVVSDDFTISLLPFILDQGKRLAQTD
ncbi:MAG: hypothetical protein JRJ00_02910 [Deltaproteobacteria bacterium]|nr:hypothetical protein [Deltaproteobacteria bacterium]